MRKIAELLFFANLIFFSNPSRADARRAHLQQLMSSYPFGMIGDDFGILEKDDLAANACIASPSSFPPELPSYPYWQCLQTKNVQFRCNYIGETDGGIGPQAFLVIEINDSLGHQEYISRRPFELVACAAGRRKWQRLTRRQSHVCISGEYISDKLEQGENVRSWIFEKYKTKTGCDSYFNGDCDSKAVVKKECDPATP